MDNRINRLAPRPGASLFILFGSYVFFLCIFSFLGEWLLPKFSDAQKGLRIIYILQALFIFIMPALIAAVTATRLPARLLCIEHRPKLMPALLTMCVMLVSIPAMEFIIQLNREISLPESMASLEQKMRFLEDNANASVQMLIGSRTIANLVMAILIVGMLAPFAEELFFRGAMQRLIGQTRLSGHTAVWLTAIIFSALHLQFYGFVPRILLGAFFGYLLLWSGNLWLPIIAHCFNNTLASVTAWMSQAVNGFTSVPDTAAPNSLSFSTPLVIASAILTVTGVYLLQRTIKGSERPVS